MCHSPPTPPPSPPPGTHLADADLEPRLGARPAELMPATRPTLQPVYLKVGVSKMSPETDQKLTWLLELEARLVSRGDEGGEEREGCSSARHGDQVGGLTSRTSTFSKQIWHKKVISGELVRAGQQSAIPGTPRPDSPTEDHNHR